jgi:hypothetical protein
LESLEQRLVPTIMWSSSGSRDVFDAGGPVITHAAVDLIFWGSGWNTDGGPAYRTQITNSVQTIMDSPYLSGLSQYRGVSNGSLLRTDTIASTSPGTIITNAQVQTFLRSNINSAVLPGPGTAGGQILYMVIPQPGTTTGTSVGGEHGTNVANPGRYHYGWTMNPSTSSLDGVTYFYSHELTEAVTDAEPNVHTAFYVPSTSNEICDGEAQSYSYRLNGVLVQSSLSQASHTYNVYTGQTQDFIVSSGRALTVNGDQLANPNDTITIDTSGGGVRVALNGEVAQFDPGRITSITVDSGSGTDTINVLRTLSGVPVTVNSSGAATVNIGVGGSVQEILGPLAITNPPSFTTVNVDDSADTTARTVSLDTVTIGGLSFGRVTGLAPAPIRYKYADTRSVTVQTGTGGATVNVLATGVSTSLVGHASGTVNVGNAGSVQQILGPLTISDPPAFAYVTVNVDDSADTTGRLVSLDTVTIGGPSFGRITGLAPAAIMYNYADTTNVTIQTGTGGATVNALTAFKPVNLIGDPSGPISLIASDAANTWTITSQNAGTLSSSLLAGTVTFSGASNLYGGNGADTFVFADGAGVDGTIDGGGGTNSLDYSAYSSSVLVDLQTGFATGVSGGIANIQNVTGGSGGGADVYNILIGNGGNVLTGGDDRRNLLIAGATASTLLGGNDDDILIGGTTAYDTEAGLASLLAIMAYWSSTTDDYATRVANLLSGNGVPLLDATMVHNNGGGNIMMGNHGGAGEMNLFYGMPTLDTADYNPGIGERFINC